MKKFLNILLFTLLTISLCINHQLMRECKRKCDVRDTTHVTMWDTIRIVIPIPRDSVVIRYDTVRVQILAEPIRLRKDSSVCAQNRDSVDLSEERVPEKADSGTHYARIPITQKTYEDSTYRAVVSGFRPSLDEISVFPRTEVVTVHVREKPKRWGVGVQAGYGFTPGNGMQPYIGIGVSYNLFSF